MNEVSPTRRQVLRRVADEVSAPLDEAGLDRQLAYLDLLQRWNATYNLTALRDPEQMLVQHLFDCLAVIQPLRRELPPTGCRLLDVGSGGGLPGVVIAALCPAWTVVCVDAVGKKAAFVRQAAVELKLPNLHGEHARVEALKAVPFDAIVSRAFAALPDFVRLTQHLLKPQGHWVAMKGKTPSEELGALPPDVEVFHVEQLSVPELKADRCLIWLRRRH